MSTSHYPPGGSAAPQTAVEYAARGDALWAAGDAVGAIAAFAQALAGNPGDARSAMNLAHALAACGNLEAALAWIRHAHATNPADPVLEMNLGTIHQRRGEIHEAAECYARALALRPDYAEAWLNYGNAALYSGDAVAAVERFEKALSHGPHLEKALSNIVYALNYVPAATRQDIRRRADEWNVRFALPRRQTNAAHADLRPDRPLRIGYVSPDLANHPIGHFLTGVLAHHERNDFHVTVYAERAIEDEMTARMKAQVPVWRKTVGMTDDQLGAQIADDQIDIVIDLAGHTSGNRLRALSAKPAPVQMTWGIGSVGTTGVAAIDYLIADRFHVPLGDESDFVETVLRLPDSLICYTPPESAPPLAALPALRNGFVTFGCFANPAKINDGLITQWAEILRDTPSSRLMLKYRWMNSSANRVRVESAFARAGVTPDRLIIEGESPQSELLARYNHIDIALDTAPYSGGATTLEALWMGVPVITRPGARVAGRHSLSFLSVLGLGSLVAADAASYRRIAVELAANLQRLAELRQTLRRRVADSALCDCRGFTRHLETLYREAWRRHCE
jgi:predicted O-linked N-acetylglucosamine transferase (SPINDLY family)